MSTSASSGLPSGSEGGPPPITKPSLAVTTRSRSSRRVGELVFALLVIGLGVFALVGAFMIRVPAGARVGPTVFPIFVSLILLVAGTAVLVSVLRGHLGTPEESEDTDPNARTDWRTLAIIAALVVAQLLLLEYIGWTLSATLLFGGVAWALGAKRWWLGFVIGFVLGLAVQILFGELLGLSLPLGPVLNWLGPLI
ncbi:tripartite tricarboxylate transporter TctB family protein [Microbacterium ureisolvens]|uniref:Tripartite tricarboxylate transporter TctB family protein n=1 Tax=Microbacterium ureisolvens TaxID=2781186 RepID=A0ABS7I2B1_9MICO|nr:tripartite tricarboxylate transporter TctB family protein [Microbacterium ureisolvens]MBW9111698.1 tripartite tricarboxylate transporter TctB family protein [Microbacterium ureisolvens]